MQITWIVKVTNDDCLEMDNENQLLRRNYKKTNVVLWSYNEESRLWRILVITAESTSRRTRGTLRDSMLGGIRRWHRGISRTLETKICESKDD